MVIEQVRMVIEQVKMVIEQVRMVIEQVRMVIEQVRAVYKTRTVTGTRTDSLTSIIECMCVIVFIVHLLYC